MAQTSPQPDFGTENEKDRIRRVISERGLVGAANDEKWGRLLDKMRQRKGWRPSYRFKCVDGPPSGWDTEWWYHLPFPMLSVEWLDIACHQIVHRGMLLNPTVVDHTEWIVCFLRDTQFCFELSGDLVRIFGYLPKSLNKPGPDPETENRE